MGSRDRVIAVLRNSTARRIRFSYEMAAHCGTMSVNHTTFERVARAIENGSIQIDETTPLPPGVFASYSDGPPNKMTVCPHNTHSRHWEANILHESVHASLDLTRSRFSEVDTESAAFFASAIYLVMTGFPVSRYDGLYERHVRRAAIHLRRTGHVDLDAINTLCRHMLDHNYNGGLMLDSSGHLRVSQGNG
jgi:hypothetical protein